MKPSSLPSSRPEQRRLFERILGLTAFGFGSFGVALLMANDGRVPFGVWIGLILLLVSLTGLLAAAVGFDASPRSVPLRESAFGPIGSEPVWLSPLSTVPAAIALLVGVGPFVGYDGLPWVIYAALVPLALSAIRRPGLAVFVVASAVYLPMLGVYGLWDPWETHYGEVAREILSRDDWISLWWAQENWFWSKPIFIFWSEALSMSFFGVAYRPDANPSHPEWALRAPHYVLAVSALLVVYAALSRVFGRRAGAAASLALFTVPLYFMLSHQAITDMPFVSNMTMAMGLLVLALRSDDDSRVRGIRVGPFAITATHIVLGGVLLVVLPQILYLATRNVTMLEGFRFAWHRDVFLHGSAGNSGVPGNAPLHEMEPFLTGPLAQPFAQAAIWSLLLAFFVWSVRRETRLQSIWMFGFYLFCGLAFMAKGIPGFALPGLVVLLYLIASRRWSLLLDGKLRVALGITTVALLGLPWLVAMYVRHGPAFTDRLLIHDHINRLASGVHGDTGSIQYFIAQLGYATFPWLGFVPLACSLFAFRSKSGETSTDASYHRRQTLMLLGLWFVAAFALFSAMITKFHHYIFPAVPPLAILCGLALDTVLGRDSEERVRGARAWATPMALASAPLLVFGVAALRGHPRGIVPKSVSAIAQSEWVLQHAPHLSIAALAICAGLALLAGSAYITRRYRTGHPVEPTGHGLTAAALIAGAVLLAFVGRDLSWKTAARPAGYERLIQLFIYMYGRPWPEQFDYRPVFGAFAIVSASLLLLGAARHVRAAAMRAMVALAVVFAAWCLDVYMIDVSPHWSQRGLVKRYYALRTSPTEPLIAWQMNWKGENFYTGNRVAAFVDLDNQKLRDWMQLNPGRKAFFILEQSRLSGFRGLMGNRKVHELTTMRDNNKFILVATQI